MFLVDLFFCGEVAFSRAPRANLLIFLRVINSSFQLSIALFAQEDSCFVFLCSPNCVLRFLLLCAQNVILLSFSCRESEHFPHFELKLYFSRSFLLHYVDWSEEERAGFARAVPVKLQGCACDE